MTKQAEDDARFVASQRPPHRIRLPGFVSDEAIGLGDVIKQATSYFGVHGCGGCEQRRVTLNHWVAFTNRHHS
jgi:hypothetical protein